MSDIYVLGINVSHDISAALVKNGQLVCAIAEERLNRIKRFTGGVDRDGMTNKHVPHLAVKYCLDAAKIGWKDVALIVVSTCVVVNYETFQTRAITREEILEQLPPDVDPNKVQIVGHHIGHAASAYYPSAFEDAVIMIADGGGSLIEKEPGEYFEERVTIYRGQGNKIEVLKQYLDGAPSNGYLSNRQHCSLGDFYQSATLFVGFKGGDEGKTMGLAPYGSNRYFKAFEDAIVFQNGSYSIKEELQFNKSRERGGDYYKGQFSSASRPGEPLRQIDKDVAAAVQHATERALIRLAREAYERTKSENLCLSGGVALNSVANKKILDETPFKNIFVQPAAGDDGCAIGNALLGWSMLLGHPRNWEMRNAYTGREYSEQEIKNAVAKYEGWLEVIAVPDVVKETARLIAEKNIVGWVQGGSEFGPRALGHRSILCDARTPEMKDIINSKVKHRESFRPFAPSILEEFNNEYFELDCPSPYMLLIAGVRKTDVVPAITHVDNSARVQTVNKKDNGVYYDLIKAYYELAGVPLILNTSFNVDGEPIVETPEDAIRCFLGTKMDYLVIGNVLLKKQDVKCAIFKILPNDMKRAAYMSMKTLSGWVPALKQLKKQADKVFGKRLSCGNVKVPG